MPRLASMTQWGPAAEATRKAIFDRVEFEIVNLSAGRPWVACSKSRMPGIWRLEYEADVSARRVLYEVRSWSTPIAWYVEDEGWVRPPIGYTSFTSRHQYVVDRALRDQQVEVRTIPRRESLALTIRIDWDWEVAA